eukprot:c54284_g1_i1 orf=117-308(+)
MIPGGVMEKKINDSSWQYRLCSTTATTFEKLLRPDFCQVVSFTSQGCIYIPNSCSTTTTTFEK